MTNFDTLLTTPGEKTIEQREKTAQACEEFGKYFPVHFTRSLTRKMHILSFVAPNQIRNDGDFFKFFRCPLHSKGHLYISRCLSVRPSGHLNRFGQMNLVSKLFKHL